MLADLLGARCTGSYAGRSGLAIFIDHDGPCPEHLSYGEAVCPEGHVYDAIDEGGPCCPYPEEDAMYDDIEDVEDISDFLEAEAALRRDEDARIDAEIAEALAAEKALLADEAILDEDWVLNLRGAW